GLWRSAAMKSDHGGACCRVALVHRSKQRGLACHPNAPHLTLGHRVWSCLPAPSLSCSLTLRDLPVCFDSSDLAMPRCLPTTVRSCVQLSRHMVAVRWIRKATPSLSSSHGPPMRSLPPPPRSALWLTFTGLRAPHRASAWDCTRARRCPRAAAT